MPERVIPMLARPGTVPESDNFAFEVKWDGIRAIAYIRNGRIEFQSRNLLSLTKQYPEFAGLAAAFDSRDEVVLDGEIVAFDEAGIPSFERLQQRMGLAERRLGERRERIPATFLVFDLLYRNGRLWMNETYLDRRVALERLKLSGPRWQTPPYFRGAGIALLESSRAQRLEGIMAKRVDSLYEPGLRSGAWIKIKNQYRQELIIAGWLPGQGARENQIGSLLTGYYDCAREEAAQRGTPQRLVYAGKAGTGFTDATLRKLLLLLQPLVRAQNPFDLKAPRYRNVVYAEPRLVGEFEFTEWTHGGTLRHPSFKGLREDKDPHDVLRETVLRSGGR